MEQDFHANDRCWKKITEVAFVMIGDRSMGCSKAACPLEQQTVEFNCFLKHKWSACFLNCLCRHNSVNVSYDSIYRVFNCNPRTWLMHVEEAYAHTANNRKCWTRIVKTNFLCVGSWITCGMLNQISIDYNWLVRLGIAWMLKNPVKSEVGMDGKVGQLT